MYGGLDGPTFVERLAKIFKARFSVAVVLWVIILGPGLQTSSGLLQYAFDAARSSAAGVPFPITLSGVYQFAVAWIPKSWSLDNISSLSIWFFSLGFPFYAVRFMRWKILDNEEVISGLLDGESAHHYFMRYTHLKPQIILAGLITVAGFGAEVASNNPFFIPNILIAQLTAGFLPSIIQGSLYWTLFCSMNGLRLVSKSTLITANYAVDSFLGLKKIGSLLLLILGTFLGFAIPQAAEGFYYVNLIRYPTFLLPFAFSIVNPIFGLVMFSLPLRGFHKKAVAHCEIAKANLRSRILESLQDKSKKDFRKLEYLESKLSSVHTWLYDFRNLQTLLRLFGTLSLAIIPLLISRLLGLPR